MPQGYYTIERWTRRTKTGAGEWTAVQQLPFGTSLTSAERAVKKNGQPGFYRLVHTQRVIWAEDEGGELRLRKSHAGSAENLTQMRKMFERHDGRYPIEAVRSARRRMKKRSLA